MSAKDWRLACAEASRELRFWFMRPANLVLLEFCSGEEMQVSCCVFGPALIGRGGHMGDIKEERSEDVLGGGHRCRRC